MAGKGTTHHRIHGWTGLVMILSLPIALWGLCCAIPGGAAGFKDWLSSPLCAGGLLVFLTSAFWYCKLEFDEVLMDYTDGGLRTATLWINRIVAFVLWAVAAFVIFKMSFGA